MPRTAQQFLTAVHRRRLLAAIVDTLAWSIGLAAVVAIGFALFTGNVTVTAIALASLAGRLLWTLNRRPTRLQTAVDLDRQLQTDDLLSTALFASGRFVDTDFSRLITAAADARFADVDPAGFAPRRVGVRGWSLTGIAVVAAAVMLLRPRAAGPNATVADGSSLMTDPIRLIALGERSQTAGPSGPRSPRITNEEGTSKIGGGVETERTAAAAAGSEQSPSGNKHAPANGGSNGGGPGQSQTLSPVENRLKASGNSVSSGGVDTGDGHARGSGGTAVAAGTQGADAAASAASPWQASGWTKARADAAVAVSSGVVPARARSLVRDYFDGE